MARAGEAVSFSNIAATTAPFSLRGGKYGVECTGTFGGGSVTLERRAADGTTSVPVGASTTFAAAGYAVVDLSPGIYEFVIATATAVYADITRIQND